jgi:PKHD-type hydroxylase
MDTVTHVPFDTLLFKLTENFPNHLHYYSYANMFSVEECKIIRDTFGELCNNDATIFGGAVSKVRQTKITWIPSNETTKWIYERFISHISDANKCMFHMDLTGLRDQIQLGLYDSTFQGNYQKHIDLGNDEYSCRKLSICVQLSDESEYTGGELLLRGAPLPKKQGSATVFPSFLEHEVCVVTTGKRYSLVLWVYGPPFR